MAESADPYTYPGTDLLRNIPDIRDAERLADFEANATVARLVELDAAPLKGRFDVGHLRAIHRHIFQDVYSWAGKFRTVNISKAGQLFGAAAFVEASLQDLLRRLRSENHLRGLEPQVFARRAGFYLGEINAIHPFRDGNGRAQREFLRELGLQAGFRIDWTKVTRGQMMAASVESFRADDSSGMAAVMEQCLK
jgi:cell filamentation protein